MHGDGIVEWTRVEVGLVGYIGAHGSELIAWAVADDAVVGLGEGHACSEVRGVVAAVGRGAAAFAGGKHRRNATRG